MCVLVGHKLSVLFDFSFAVHVWAYRPLSQAEVLGGCVFQDPRSARRVPQPHREYSSESVFEPEARSVRPASWRAPGGARNGGRGRALRGVLSFGSFSLHEQRKGTCRGSATHKLIFVIAEGDSIIRVEHKIGITSATS